MPSQRRRIAIVFEFCTLNGGEHSILANIEQLTGTPFEIVALAEPEGPLAAALAKRNIEVVPFSVRGPLANRIPERRACEALERAVARISPDVLHANSLSMGRLTGQVAPRLSIPCVVHLRDIMRLSPTAVAHLNQNRRLIAVSLATRAFHMNQGVDGRRTPVIYNGVDCERFQPRSATGWLRRELGIPRDAFLVATIGQISLRKGQDVFSEAAARVQQRLSNVAYLIVGMRHSAKRETVDFENDVVRRFERSSLVNRLFRPGHRNDVNRMLNEVDLLVHPARQEPLGRVLLEASASGTPIVATDVGGTSEILRDGETGLLVPPDDSAALAAAIVELHDDADKRARFAQAARRHVLRHFTAQRATSELIAVWEEVLSSPST